MVLPSAILILKEDRFRGQLNEKKFYSDPLFSSFFGLFDVVVNFFAQVFWFKGILKLKKVNAGALVYEAARARN
jgi:hypothetical protein